MTDRPQQRLVVELEKTGERTDKILEYSLTSNWLTPADGFEFVVYDNTDPVGLRRKFAPWRRVNLYVDGELQLLGRIDETEGSGESGSALRVRGRDYIGDLVDSGADPSMLFTAGQDLGDALLMLLKPFGIRTLVGSWNLTRNLLSGKQPFVGEPTGTFVEAKLSEFKIEDNMGVWEVLDKIVSRHGFTGQQAGKRDSLCIVPPQYGQDPVAEFHRPGNVLRATCRRSWQDIPTVTIATGRGGGKHGTKTTNNAKYSAGTAADPLSGQFPSFGELAVNPIGQYDEVQRIVDPERGADEVFTRRANWKKVQFEAEDHVIYRPLFYSDKKSKTDKQIEHGVKRELSRRMKDALVYECTVLGHRDPKSGAIYTVDTMATVVDEVEDVNERLWCVERTLSNDGRTGTKTSMKWIRSGSLDL